MIFAFTCFEASSFCSDVTQQRNLDRVRGICTPNKNEEPYSLVTEKSHEISPQFESGTHLVRSTYVVRNEACPRQARSKCPVAVESKQASKARRITGTCITMIYVNVYPAIILEE